MKFKSGDKVRVCSDVHFTGKRADINNKTLTINEIWRKFYLVEETDYIFYESMLEFADTTVT